jgi:hypothetical protein
MDSLFIEAICLAAAEILGEKDAYDILKEIGVSSFSAADTSRFTMASFGNALARRYGPQVAMGLMIRIGRASLTFLRRFFPEISELGGIENRLKPLDKRYSDSLGILADLAGGELKDPVKVVDQDGLSFEWQVNTTDPSCTPYYHFGLLEEFCYWLDARKDCRIVYAAEERKAHFAVLSIQIKDME